MTRPSIALLFGGVVGLVMALCAIAGCGGGHAKPATSPDSGADADQVPATAEHVYGPAPPTAASGVALRPQHPPFSDPRLVAVAEAETVCNFDWHESLATRIARASVYATPVYRQTLTPSPTDTANWLRTRHDGESAVCSVLRSYAMSSAPNTPTVRFERVDMIQRVSVAGRSTSTQPYGVLYRVERQPDGGWLVGADGEGG